jgi:hypothetical protein
MTAPTPSSCREEAARQVSDAMVEAAAAVLLGRVNAPEQEIYAAARAALTAALAVDEQSWRRW